MQTELFSVSKLFTETLLRIPDYQRGYAWTDKQLKDFWSDIEQLAPGDNHYTGVLTLEDVPVAEWSKWDDDRWIIDAKSFKPYYVVDGQQRLTTTVILLQALTECIGSDQFLNYTSRDEIKKRFIFESRDQGVSRSYIFGYEKDNPSYEYLKTRIFGEKSDIHSTIEETVYTTNLQFAKDFFLSKLKEFDGSNLASLFTKITQHLLFNIYAISREIDVFVAFETMNNRGKPLSHLELLKNRLIFLSTKFDVDVEERGKLRRTINESWKSLYHYLGKNKKQPLDDNVFLYMHFVLYFELPSEDGEDRHPIGPLWRFRRDDYYKDYLLEKVFTIRALVPSEGNPTPLTVQYIYKYAHDIKSSVKDYYYAMNPQDESADFDDKERILLEKVRRIASSDSMVMVFAVVKTAKRCPERLQFLEVLENVLFLGNIASMSHRRVDGFHLDWQAVIYIKKSMSLKELVEKFHGYRANLVKAIDLSQELGNWSKNYGAYGWRGLKYFLFEYEQLLKSRSKTKRDKLEWAEFASENYEVDYSTIEHIFPQTATDRCWKQAFDGYTTKQKSIMKHSLGNLLPLSKPKNSSMKNSCFKDKKGDATNQVGYAYGCYSEIEVAQEGEWTATQILQRGIRMLEFMEKRWGLQLGNHQVKAKLLGLDFVEPKETMRH